MFGFAFFLNLAFDWPSVPCSVEWQVASYTERTEVSRAAFNLLCPICSVDLELQGWCWICRLIGLLFLVQLIGKLRQTLKELRFVRQPLT